MRLNFLKLNDKAQLPTYGSSMAAGLDLYASEDVVIKKGESIVVGTGIAMDLTAGFEAEVRGRSGLAFKHQVFAFNGTIDADYKGEIKVLLTNHGKETFKIEAGARVAQMIIRHCLKVVPCWHVVITKTDRGQGGFGSTGS